jgi:hypothetical protein
MRRPSVPRDQHSTASPNDRQVGGAHYKSKIQHWDYVLANELDYFQGQITKYVTRWRQKGGIQDLEKARHFLDKYIEAVRAGTVPVQLAIPGVAAPQTEQIRATAAPTPNGDKVTEATPPAHMPNGSLHPIPEVPRQAETYPAEGLPEDTSWSGMAASAALERAKAYANEKPNEDVPVGWVLEGSSIIGWGYRKARGGNWSRNWLTRQAALYALLKEIKNDNVK